MICYFEAFYTRWDKSRYAVCAAPNQVCAVGNVQISLCGNFFQQKWVLVAGSVLLCWGIVHTNNAKILKAFVVDCMEWKHILSHTVRGAEQLQLLWFVSVWCVVMDLVARSEGFASGLIKKHNLICHCYWAPCSLLMFVEKWKLGFNALIAVVKGTVLYLTMFTRLN